MAPLSQVEGWAAQPPGKQGSVLLVSEDLQELAYYHAILQKLGCKVRTCSSCAEGMQRLSCEPFDLIMVDQGSDGFEGQKVLAEAMAIDVELRVLVLAKSYNKGCYLEAMRSGALDYLEGPLSAADIVALVDTFMPRRTGGHSALRDRFKRAELSKERMIKVKSNQDARAARVQRTRNLMDRGLDDDRSRCTLIGIRKLFLRRRTHHV